jgi:hypothetical protein
LKKNGASKTPKAASPKATKTPKAASPKAASPKSFKSSAPSGVPSLSPTKTPRIQAFYSNEVSKLDLTVTVNDDTYLCDGLEYTVDLGTVKDLFGKENMALVQTSFTTSIDFAFNSHDDDAVADYMDSNVFLEMVAYAGCDSAVSCAGITGSPLIPEQVEMFGWSRNVYVDYNDDNDLSAIVDDETHQDIFTSTNDANFILVGKGTGDIFLQAKITIDMCSAAFARDSNYVNVFVNNWVVVVQHEEGNMKVTEFEDFPTASPTTGGAP